MNRGRMHLTIVRMYGYKWEGDDSVERYEQNTLYRYLRPVLYS
jgi:hypothetical protein